MKKAPEQFRTRGTSEDENNGFFVMSHYRINGYELRAQISDGMGWEHVSISVAPEGKHATRCPTWEEMCYMKDIFWNEDECVIQYHPPKNVYVSCHPFVLHLWKPIGIQLPIPESILVGPKEFIKK
jgi:hypothetical protein